MGWGANLQRLPSGVGVQGHTGEEGTPENVSVECVQNGGKYVYCVLRRIAIKARLGSLSEAFCSLNDNPHP